MKIRLNVSLEDLENEINRQIIVDENIELMDLCEYIITSMDGKKIPIYILEYNKVFYYPCNIIESRYEKTLENLTLKDFKLKKNKEFYIGYNFDNYYYFNVTVDDIFEDTSYDNNDNFKVISGKGYGIIDDERAWYLKSVLTNKRKDLERHCPKNVKEYLQKTFDIDKNNNKIKEYIEHKNGMFIPKRYVFNVSLKGFDKEIKRKICVNSDILINNFCQKVILAMNGDLSHQFDIKKNKEYLGENYGDFELFYLNLKEKQRLKIMYDFGDNWAFNLTVSKVIENFSENDFEVLSGKGYGIIDDCGGIWGLENIFNGKDTSWGIYDINEFDLEKLNSKINKYFK